jgi:hypothetical protein
MCDLKDDEFRGFSRIGSTLLLTVSLGLGSMRSATAQISQPAKSACRRLR